ncbi:MAG: phosphoenolpyruvate--protein phosphotransferase [Micrococcales bacterium]|nr:phosphoenolpyruvate--protein phosphotransferase [Micrococcales bacterium]
MADSTRIESPATSGDVAQIRGTGVVPGVGYAPAAWTRPRPQVPASAPDLPEGERDAAKERFTAAANAVSDRLRERAGRVTGVASEVLLATSALAKDRGWIKAAHKQIAAGMPPAQAAVAATEQFVVMFTKLGGLMAERVTDLRDIRDRVVAELEGLPEPGVPRPSAPVVILAEDLAPADTAELDASLIVGLVTSLGGPTSHTSIIARQRGIPCIVAAHGIEAIEDGEPILVDGTSGVIERRPDEAAARGRVAADAEERERIRTWTGPAQTSDGHRVDLLANVQNGESAQQAAAGQAEGVGLFRTELCFLNRDAEPEVEEQTEIYREVFAAFPAEAKVVLRTLDAGSDKPLEFATAPDEPNPALGVRGVRTSFGNEGLLTRQLDAARAASVAARGEDASTWVMAPMIATIPEAEDFAAKCRERGITPGVMVEVPSVAMLAEEFLEVVDFFSIGTNDLTQYAMAADRMSPDLATLTDPWQPAVLRLIARTAEAGQRAGKPVGVCGEAAADPVLACVLVGFGVTSLSMAAAAVPSVGARLGQVTLEQCKSAAAAVMKARDSVAAREVAATALA